MGLFGPPDLLDLGSKKDIDGLLKVLRYKKSAEVRRDAAWWLANFKEHRAVDPLLTLLNDEDPGVRRNAAMALHQLWEPRAVDAMVPLLGDPDASVRRAAASALGDAGEQRVVNPLLVSRF